MDVEEAIRCTAEAFPFCGYMSRYDGKGAYSNLAKTVLRHLKPGSTILDFGSGPCDKTAILQRLGYRCSAYDDLQDDWHKILGNREKIISFADKCGIDFRLATTEINVAFQQEMFDMIMVHGVLEHLHDSPRDLLNKLLELAKPNGLLFVTVPNAVNIRKRIDVLFGRTNLPRFEGYYWYPGAWRGHVREYVRSDLALLSKFLNCEILELRGCDHMLQKVPKSLRPAYLVVTGLFQGWKDSWLLVAKKKGDWTPKTSLTESELAVILGKSTSYDYTKQSYAV